MITCEIEQSKRQIPLDSLTFKIQKNEVTESDSKILVTKAEDGVKELRRCWSNSTNFQWGRKNTNTVHVEHGDYMYY